MLSKQRSRLNLRKIASAQPFLPQVQQLIEIHTANSKKSHILTLFEVCWTRQIQSGMHDCQCLVGCRLSFGPSPYFLFQKKSVEHLVAQPLS